MKVQMEVTFSMEDIIAMCFEKCPPLAQGTFEAVYRMHSGEVVCTFVPDAGVVVEQPPTNAAGKEENE